MKAEARMNVFRSDMTEGEVDGREQGRTHFRHLYQREHKPNTRQCGKKEAITVDLSVDIPLL